MRLLAISWSLALAACTIKCPEPAPESVAADKPAWGIAVHGGAGVLAREALSPEREAAARAALEEGLRRGHQVLAEGGSALDAVTAAVTYLEDSPVFNAGKGAVFTHDGRNELDAAIMEGHTLRAGAVAGLTKTKNPVLLARAVMEKSPHVMMIGAGAEVFGEQLGIEQVPKEYFFTQHAWDELQKVQAKERAEKPMGTVDAVALDRHGHLAAATSTGGMTNKRYGRVGDVPVIGAGTYANARCAVSATGHGEYFIRHAVSHDICARQQYQGLSVRAAADAVVRGELVKAGGVGGVIVFGADGEVALVFNSPAMFRGTMGANGAARVAIFADE